MSAFKTCAKVPTEHGGVIDHGVASSIGGVGIADKRRDRRGYDRDVEYAEERSRCVANFAPKADLITDLVSMCCAAMKRG